MLLQIDFLMYFSDRNSLGRDDFKSQEHSVATTEGKRGQAALRLPA